jgi:hypothetical protein
VLYLVLMLGNLDSVYTLLCFFTTNNNWENIYCEYKSEIFRFLNSSLQESLFSEFVIILIILFWILKILIL